MVQRASLSLFLKDQYRRQSQRIASAIEKNGSLKEALIEIRRIEKRIHALDEQIEEDENIELVKAIVDAASPVERNRRNDLSPLMVFYLDMLKAIASAASRILKI